MFKSILVSLDGSALAEQALPPAVALATGFGATILLLRVVAPERARLAFPYLPEWPAGPEADPTGVQVSEAQAYLDGLSLTLPGRPVQTRVLVGAPPQMIVATAVEAAVDLIAMSTHGRSGLTRLLYGSVAEAVLRGSPVPVLMVPSRMSAVTADEPVDHAVLAPVAALPR